MLVFFPCVILVECAFALSWRSTFLPLTSVGCFLQRFSWMSWSGFISLSLSLWQPVWDLAVSNDTLTINTRNFFCHFCSIFVNLKLPQHLYVNNLFQFLHFRNVGSHRLTYVVHSFTIETKITDKGTLFNQVNFSYI